MIEKQAYEFAKNKHKGQLDDMGMDYFKGHILVVVQILKIVTSDVALIAAAYLHDTIEDTETTYEELREIFGQEIADLVVEVTHEGKKDDKGYYFPNLHSKKAIILKFADRLSNLTRMSPWNTKRQEAYLKKSVFWKKEP